MTGVTTGTLPPLTTHGLRGVLDSAPRACQEEPEFFTALDGETPRAHAKRVGAARVICADCPVQLACLGYALRTRATSGVWAGLDADAGELGYLLTAALGVAVLAAVAIAHGNPVSGYGNGFLVAAAIAALLAVVAAVALPALRPVPGTHPSMH